MAGRIRRRNRANTVVPVASMGDIAFLLIIFFIVTSNLVKHQTARLDLPVSDQIEEIRDVPPIGVALDLDGVLFLDGQQLAGVGELTSKLEVALRGNFGDNTELYMVLLQVHNTLDDAAYMPVIKAIAEAGARIQMAGMDAK